MPKKPELSEKDKRTLYKVTRFSPAEYSVVKQRMADANVKSFSHFMRQSVLTSAVYIADFSALREYAMQISKVGTNINQIAKWANSDHSVSQDSIDEVQRQMDAVLEITRNVIGDRVAVSKKFREAMESGVHRNSLDHGLDESSNQVHHESGEDDLP